jgi:hypothetical protein
VIVTPGHQIWLGETPTHGGGFGLKMQRQFGDAREIETVLRVKRLFGTGLIRTYWNRYIKGHNCP